MNNNLDLARGDKVTLSGFAGVATVLERYTVPGEQDARVKLAFHRPRSGKLCAVRTDYEKNCSRV